MNQLRLRDFDADALLSFGVVYGFGSCVMVCANAADHPAAASKITIRKRPVRRLGASVCSDFFGLRNDAF
jgi:hypothetical protein